jgi:NAD(P)-dependent dehydrogenase (short-subunit alcohol dehydrogenase family)/acyl carrier protein
LAAVPVVSEAPAAPVVSTVASLLAVVAEATGYPEDMLELDMDLESDLGIDSIKRVEILSLLSERLPHAPVVEPENLGDLRTLRAVAEFVGDAPAVVPLVAPTVAPTAAPVEAASTPVDAHAALLAVVAESTGYPEDMLELDMDLESDLGIDSIKRVEILSLLSERLPNAPVVEPEQLGGLRTLREVLTFVENGAGARSTTDVDRVETAVRSLSRPPSAAVETPWRSASRPEVRRVVAVSSVGVDSSFVFPLQRTVFVSQHPDLTGPIIAALEARGVAAKGVDGEVPAELASTAGGLVLFGDSLPRAFAALRSVGSVLPDVPGAFVLSLVQGDGSFGLAGGDLGPAGGLAGLVKSAAREWPGVVCRAVDVSDLDAADAVSAALDELGRPGPVERGLGVERSVLRTEIESGGGLSWAAASAHVTARLGDGCVVVTGGARGVTAECAVALADAGAKGLLLLGRSTAPQAEEAWLSDATSDAEIKKALLAHAVFDGRPTPRVLGQAAARVAADREIRSTLARIAAVGGHAIYRSVDARDPAAVATAVDEARVEFGPIRGIVHGAGVLRDKLIVDKSDADFALVVDTKLASLGALLAAVAGDELNLIALFSSVSGRFGRMGQSDYAAANQALDAAACAEAARRPNCRVVSLAWGPWDGGMVTPALKKQFESEGVALLGRPEGARVFVDECGSEPSRPVLLVVGSGLDEGTLITTLSAPKETAMFLTLASDPYLDDHRLDGVPVLPLAMSMELLAEAAVAATGGELLGLDEVRVLRGVTLPDGAADVVAHVGVTRPDGDGLRAAVELRSPDGRVHVRAVARVGAPGAQASSPSLTPLTVPAIDGWDGTPQGAYENDLFHGPSFQCITAIEGSSAAGMVLTLAPTPRPSVWRPGSSVAAWTTGPLPIDGVFQALILWCRKHQGGPSLPSRVAAYHQFASFPDGPLRAVVRVRKATPRSVLSDVDLVAEDGRLVARVEGFACTVSAKLDRAFGRSAAPPETPASI